MKNDNQASHPRLVLIRCNDSARSQRSPQDCSEDFRVMFGYPPAMTSNDRRNPRSVL
jgi:hypothetical protein